MMSKNNDGKYGIKTKMALASLMALPAALAQQQFPSAPWPGWVGAIAVIAIVAIVILIVNEALNK